MNGIDELSEIGRKNYGLVSQVRYGTDDDSGLDGIPLMMSDEGFDTDENEYLMNARKNARHGRNGCYYFFCGWWIDALYRCWSSCFQMCKRKKVYNPRTVYIGRPMPLDGKYPQNITKNQKYNFFTFIPAVLFNQFKFFLNFYFLAMAISQFVPSLRVGYLYTYWAPLGFVIGVTMIREAVDDLRRRARDKELNGMTYTKLTKDGTIVVPSSSIKVGDMLFIEKDQRVPADMVLLRTTDKQGTCFIRTDQLDGETDWKLRVSVGTIQSLENDSDVWDMTAQVYAEAPGMDIHNFLGTFSRTDGIQAEEPLSIENTLWANTVLASGLALGIVVYTGTETRASMNTSQPSSKVGLLDHEVNKLTKILFVFVFLMSLIMVGMKGFYGAWYIYMFRFIVLFSYIIPISLRVNLDVAKIVYSYMVMKDDAIPGTIVRSTTIPEELGRVNYLLSDKTGTLTQNEMIFKKLHLGTVAYTTESFDEVAAHVRTSYSNLSDSKNKPMRVRKTVITRVFESVKAIALCHNVTPVYEQNDSDEESGDTEADQGMTGNMVYQASSPDEVSLVNWTKSINLTLVHRDITTITLKTPHGTLVHYELLKIFPFTSESKRMGIIVKDVESGEITFYMKGADSVMQNIVQFNDWLEEECGNMAREGLRTLVVGKKVLKEDQYQDFEARYHQAKCSMQDRNAKVANVIESLERDLELVCLTGVEDKLQDNVRPTLELLRNAGIKIWMLTGDKLETATCIAKSTRLFSRMHSIHTFRNVTSRGEAHLELNSFRRKNDCCLIITGSSLEVVLKYYKYEFVELACQCPAVVVCRCSPTQKADIVLLLKSHTGKQMAAIGDGGNDVSMIQAADAGIGIEGKEGRQASLAADFSLTQFSHIGKLILVHGRYSYLRSSVLSHFIIHRGLLISTMQAVFSAMFYFVSLSLFPSILVVGYSTVFTTLPVFSLVLDKDVTAETAMTYPEIYKELMKGRAMSSKTFFVWVLVSLYQGSVLMYGALLLFEEDYSHITSISFSALILTELIMVAMTVRTWHWAMLVSEIISVAIYVATIAVFPYIFDYTFLMSVPFLWKCCAITAVSCIPLYIIKYLRKKFSPPSYSKLQA